MRNEFRLVAGHPALDFANTLDYRFDPARRVELLSDYEQLLEFARQSELITGKQARKLFLQSSKRESSLTLLHAIEIREALDSLFRSVVAHRPPSDGCIKTLNRYLVATRVQEAVSWQHSDFVRRYDDLAGRPDGPIWPVVDAAADLLSSPKRHHIRECSEPSCRWLFLDQTKNHSRRWCDMGICGNRSKVRRFRERQDSPSM